MVNLISIFHKQVQTCDFVTKKGYKAISFEHFTSSSTPAFFNLKILKMHDLLKLKLLIFVYNCANISLNFHSLF